MPSRNVTFTADLTVAVTGVGAAYTEASLIIWDLGGFLFGQNTIGTPNPQTTLVFKIDPKNFQVALAALRNVGEICL